jgi:uncharacterized membrane protein YfcA
VELPPLAILAVVWLGAFLGGLAAGAAGFAFGIVGAAIWLHALEPVQATMLVVTGGTIIQVGTLWPLRHSLEWPRLWPFLAAGLAGVPIGVALLVYTDPRALKIALGIFLAAYGIYALAAPRLPSVTGGGRAADAGIGFAGGVLGGIGGYSGVLPAIWCQLRGWPKDIARAVYQPFILMAHVVTLILVGTVALDRSRLLLFVLSIPAVLAGAYAGWRLYGHLDETRFRQVFAVILVISGLVLVL